MFCVLKHPRRLVYFVNFFILKNQRFLNSVRPYSYFANYSSLIRLSYAEQCKGFLVSNDQSRLTLSRYKYDSRKKRQKKRYDEESSDEEDEDDDDDDDDFEAGKGAEIKTLSFKSLRIDAVLKKCLGVSRNQIHQQFYQNKIRVNGEIVLKKSLNARLNDEIDLIKGYSGASASSLIVSRVKILKIEADPNAENIDVKIWKCKSLQIDNYHGQNAWKEPEGEE